MTALSFRNQLIDLRRAHSRAMHYRHPLAALHRYDLRQHARTCVLVLRTMR